jgi:hypothetical protein
VITSLSKSQIQKYGKCLKLIFTLDENTYDFFAPVLERYLLDVNDDYLELSAYDNTIELRAVTPEDNDYLRGFGYQFEKRLRNLQIGYSVRGNYDVLVQL